jgi:hypothetical protein
MDAPSFDRLTRAIGIVSSRRQFGTALAVLAAGAATWAERAPAKQGKKRKKKLKLNQFGCVNVGGKCRGKDGVCCSGICEGKKPKKRKRDKSHCVGHDARTCPPGQTPSVCSQVGLDVPCTTGAGLPGHCATTTGEAAYCAFEVKCFACQKDADCIPFCGPQAACILCTPECLDGGLTTACVGPRACTF